MRKKLPDHLHVRVKKAPLRALYGNTRIPLEICRSNAGYYIGRMDTEDGTPYARDSEEYFRTFEAAEAAINEGLFTLRRHP